MGDMEFDGTAEFAVHIESADGALTVRGSPGTGSLSVTRASRLPELHFDRRYGAVLQPSARRRLQLFVDGPLAELFIEPECVSVTAAVPVAAAFDVHVEVAGKRCELRWKSLRPQPPSGSGQ
jgi:hypothetical protein